MGEPGKDQDLKQRIQSAIRKPVNPRSAEVIASALEVIKRDGATSLVVDDLRRDDFHSLSWWSSPSHLRSMAKALERVPIGEVEYLAVRAPSGEPVAKGGIDYVMKPGAGTLWQLATLEPLQGLGIGTLLINVAEERIQKRGLTWATMGVEENNPRARTLYERLGYRHIGREPASWEQEDEEGNITLYQTELTWLRKKL